MKKKFYATEWAIADEAKMLEHKLSRIFGDQHFPNLGIIEQKSNYRDIYKAMNKESLGVIMQ